MSLPSFVVYVKREEFARLWNKFFPFRPFSKGFSEQEIEQHVTNIDSHVKNWGESQAIPSYEGKNLLEGSGI